MLNRIHKLTKHDYNGKREPTGHAKLAETVHCTGRGVMRKRDH